MQAIKGMVQVEGSTYRIVRIAPAYYEVVRVLDDAPVGRFQSAPILEVEPRNIDSGHLREIALAAIRGAKTSWVGRLPAGFADQPSASRT